MKETIYFDPPTMHLDLFIFEPKTFSIQLIYSWENTNNNKGLVTTRGRWRTPHHPIDVEAEEEPIFPSKRKEPILYRTARHMLFKDSDQGFINHPIVSCRSFNLDSPPTPTMVIVRDSIDFPLKSLFIYIFFLKCCLNVELCQYLILYEW